MLRILFISIFISGSCFAQDTLLIDDGSIWFTKNSCSVDFRCFDNIDDFISAYCSDTLTITSVELQENVFSNSKKTSLAECRAQQLVNYLKGKHGIDVASIKATPIFMDAEEMRMAISQQNFRTIVFVLNTPPETEL